MYRTIISKAYELIQKDLTKSSEIPGLILLMNKPTLLDEEMGPLGLDSTMYRDTISFNGSNRLSKSASSSLSNTFARTFPKSTSDHFVSSIEMDPAACVLNAGTAKGTMKLAGYTGHIPMNKRNVRKVEHSFGLDPRPQKNDLLVTRGCIGGVVGYTGTILIIYLNYEWILISSLVVRLYLNKCTSFCRKTNCMFATNFEWSGVWIRKTHALIYSLKYLNLIQ